MYTPRKRPFVEVATAKIWENPTGTQGDVYLPKKGGVLSTNEFFIPSVSTSTRPILTWNSSSQAFEYASCYVSDKSLLSDQKVIVGNQSLNYVPGVGTLPFVTRYDVKENTNSKFWYSGPKLLEQGDKFLLAGYKNNSLENESYNTRIELDRITGKVNTSGGTAPGYQVNGVDVITSIPIDISLNSISNIGTNVITVNGNFEIAAGKSIRAPLDQDLSLITSGTGAVSCSSIRDVSFLRPSPTGSLNILQGSLGGKVRIPRFENVERFDGASGVYCEMETPGQPPAANFVSNLPWSVGCQNSGNMDHQMSMGIINNSGSWEGLLYSYNQGSGSGPTNMNIGFPSIPMSICTLWANQLKVNNALHNFNPLTTSRTFTWPDKNGTVAMLSDLGGGGLSKFATVATWVEGGASIYNTQSPTATVSFTKLGTGWYEVQCLNGIAQPVACIAGAGLYGFISVEYISSTIVTVYIRNTASSAMNSDFNINFLST